MALAGLAHADDRKSIRTAVQNSLGWNGGDYLPALVLIDSDTKLKEEFIDGDGSPSNSLLHVVVGMAADSKAGWLAADSGVIVVCGNGDCDKVFKQAAHEAEVKPPYHHTALVDNGKVVFLHAGATGKGVGAGSMDAQIDDDAKPIVEQFKKTIGDPKAFAATISARKDVVLYGTEPTERFVGGAAARATLMKWNLALSLHGNMRAGLTKSKTLAWIATDVDAGKTIYRLTVIYEKTGSDWKLVEIHFS